MFNNLMQSLRLSLAGGCWESGLGVAHGNWYAKVSAQQFPGWLPAVALDQTAQGQDGLSARQGPGHTRLLQALSDQGFAGGFDHPTGNGQALAKIFGIAHAMSLVTEVGQLGLQSFSLASLCSATVI